MATIRSDTSVAALPSRDEFLRNGLLPFARSRKDLEILGRPDSIHATAVANRHVPGVTDTLFVIHYPGLVLETHQPGGAAEMVSAVEVSRNRYLRYPVIGMLRSEIKTAFGAPGEVGNERDVYGCMECVGAEEPVELVFEGGRVRRVRFTYYVD